MKNQSEKLTEFIAELRNITAGDIRTDQYNRQLYSTDASIYQQLPLGVFLPKNKEEIGTAVALAHKYKIPLLPRAGGSSLAGQTVNEAFVIDTSRHLNKILQLNKEEQSIWVQPGVVLDHLNAYLKPHQLQFGPDPASSNRACMGGIISNNSTGSHSILYGMSADHLLELNLFLNDGSFTHLEPLSQPQLEQRTVEPSRIGSIYHAIQQLTTTHETTIQNGTPTHWRRCGGYNLDRFVSGTSFNYPRDERFNLANLICGAEGTLGLITEIKLNLVPTPKKTALAIIHFSSLSDALNAVPLILEINPSAVELLDHLGITLCRDVPEYARLLTHFVDGTPNCLLITEFYGESEAELRSKVRELEAHLERASLPLYREGTHQTAVVPLFTPEEQARVWQVRKVGLGLMMSIKGDYKPVPFIEDAAVPVADLAEYINEIERFCLDLGTEVAYYAHASAGCLHVRPLVNSKKAEEIAKLPEIGRFSAQLVKKYGGAISSEHGDGRVRSWLNEQFHGKELYELFREVKDIFDPDNLFNPGNIVDAPPMTEKLRYGSSYQIIPLTPNIDFTSDQGFDRAVEMCNGAGICRKIGTGTMCPSFMATREEEHSTRGRANALRAVLSGQLPPDELYGERLAATMDLCISCKACKAECPSSVDMAKIKLAYQAQYYEKNQIPFRSRLFSQINLLSDWSSGPLASLANWSLKQKLVRRAMEKSIGITEKRPLPIFASQSFDNWFEKRRRKVSNREKTVLLFADTFNRFNDPHIAIAATRFLELAGYTVLIPEEKSCCGRPALSKGLVDIARQQANATIASLKPYVKKGIPIIGLEPSCLLSFQDEYLYLLPENEDAKQLAAQSFLFEQFVAQEADAGRLNLRFTEQKRTLLLHAHCHQKSLVGTAATKKILSLPPNYTVSEIDSGCCGMAGSFGYETEHYQLSLKIGEDRLFPAIRTVSHETIIVATGTSCRHQIEHGTERQSLHPAEILYQAVNKL